MYTFYGAPGNRASVLRVNTAFRAFEFPGAHHCESVKKSFGGVALQELSRRRMKEVKGSLPCLGLAHAGRNTVATFSRELNDAARAADIATNAGLELVVHPGANTTGLESKYSDWRFNWTGERDALLSPQLGDAVAAAGYVFAGPSTPADRTSN